MPSPFTQDELKVLDGLRNKGFAVCVFTPEELEKGKCSRKAMEEVLVESGNEILVDIEDVTTWRNPEDHIEEEDDEPESALLMRPMGKKKTITPEDHKE